MSTAKSIICFFFRAQSTKAWWRHQQWSPSRPPSWILPRIRNQVKTARNDNLFVHYMKTRASHYGSWWKITRKYTLCMILATRCTFIVEKSWKNMYYQQKMASPPATYDVIFRNHSNWPSLCARDERTATENVRCWCFILSVKTQKNLTGGGIHPPPLYVRGLNKARMGVPKVFWLETPSHVPLPSGRVQHT